MKMKIAFMILFFLGLSADAFAQEKPVEVYVGILIPSKESCEIDIYSHTQDLVRFDLVIEPKTPQEMRISDEVRSSFFNRKKYSYYNTILLKNFGGKNILQTKNIALSLDKDQAELIHRTIYGTSDIFVEDTAQQKYSYNCKANKILKQQYY